MKIWKISIEMSLCRQKFNTIEWRWIRLILVLKIGKKKKGKRKKEKEKKWWFEINWKNMVLLCLKYCFSFLHFAQKNIIDIVQPVQPA